MKIFPDRHSLKTFAHIEQTIFLFNLFSYLSFTKFFK